MNHKRRRPKHQRAGCILCKPHKDERAPKVAPVAAQRRMQPDGDGYEPEFDECDWNCQHCYEEFAHEYGDGLDVEVLPPLTQRLPL